MQTVPVSNKVKAIFRCSKCRRTEAADISNYINLEKTLNFNVNCLCGYKYTAILDKRKQHRKETNFLGTFVQLIDGKEVYSGTMTVCDLSLSGVKLKVNAEHLFSIGDLLQVDFELDDLKKSNIIKKVIIRNFAFPFLGTEFHYSEIMDQALGYYLFK
ncbi:MAG: PilZ domain-containing protein [Deltaproteobacteria bacterium]|nr:PilZ domain-containing protein [Deltaproteobacteria bacterium]